MRRHCLILLAGALALGGGFESGSQVSRARAPAVRRELDRGFGDGPLAFEPNRGQAGAGVRFVARPRGGVVLLGDDQAVLVSRSGASIQMRWSTGARPPAGERLLPGIVNYFLGDDPSRWRTGIPTYRAVRYPEVAPGIDLLFHGDGRQLEYDWEVAPGADLAQLALSFEGVDSLAIAPDGALWLTAGSARLEQLPPRVFQRGPSGPQPVSARYLIRPDGKVGVAVGERDPRLPLLIDPVLVYSSYFGGSGSDVAGSIAVDDVGSVYLTGWTDSIDFPLTNPFMPGPPGTTTDGGNGVTVTSQHHAWVAKLDPSGQYRLFSTYFGGSGSDIASKVAVDSRYNVYVVGLTNSVNLPTANALLAARQGGDDAFVAEFSPDGTTLLFSTYWGGPNTDQGFGLALDSQGAIHLAGRAGASFPTTSGAVQRTPLGNSDGFLSRFVPDAGGFSVAYSTYLGGSGDDVFYRIALDDAGNDYLGGDTTSPDFPRATSGYQATLAIADGGVCVQAAQADGGSYQPQDGVLAEISAAGALTYASYLGGTGSDFVQGIALDQAGDVYLTGATASPDFPVTFNAIQKTGSSTCNQTFAFATKFVPLGSPTSFLAYSTYLGGVAGNAQGIAVDAPGHAFVVQNAGALFPVLNPFPNGGGAWHGDTDIGIIELDPSGALLSSSLLGGSDYDFADDVALDSKGNLFVAGHTYSTDFPTLNAEQSTPGGTVIDYDGVVAKLAISTDAGGASDGGAPSDAGPRDAGASGGDGGTAPTLYGWSCASAPSAAASGLLLIVLWALRRRPGIVTRE